MNRKKLFLSLSAFAAFGVAALLGTTQIKPLIHTSAEECNHSVVEHYDATATTIEHWACCLCHQAWADEAKELLVRNVQFDKTRSATYYEAHSYTGDVNNYWGGTFYAGYSSDYGFVYTHELTAETSMLYIDAKNAGFDFDTVSQYEIEITNNTTGFLHINIFSLLS